MCLMVDYCDAISVHIFFACLEVFLEWSKGCMTNESICAYLTRYFPYLWFKILQEGMINKNEHVAEIGLISIISAESVSEDELF